MFIELFLLLKHFYRQQVQIFVANSLYLSHSKRPKYETHYYSGGLLFRNLIVSARQEADSSSFYPNFHFSFLIYFYHD